MIARTVKLQGNYEPEYFALKLTNVQPGLDKSIRDGIVYLKVDSFVYDQLDDPEAFFSELARKINS